MALIIRKLYHKENYESVTLDEAKKSRISETKTFVDEGERFRIAKYDIYSRPVDSHSLTYVEKYNGSVEDAPISVFSFRDGQVMVQTEEVAASLQRKWGDGQYTVFKFGGTPPKETYFQNRFVEKIEGEGSEAGN